MNNTIKIQQKGECDYQQTWQQMLNFTLNRDQKTTDQAWLLQHPPVFTQGLAGKPEHILQSGDIPVIQSDRGGQVTYHGPGQLVGYFLLDLKRRGLSTRDLVIKLETVVIDLLKTFDIDASGDRKAPGVYVGSDKIASIGLRVKNQCCYHGIAINIDMDLSPFKHINPCGFEHLKVIDIKSVKPMMAIDFLQINHTITTIIQRVFN